MDRLRTATVYTKQTTGCYGHFLSVTACTCNGLQVEAAVAGVMGSPPPPNEPLMAGEKGIREFQKGKRPAIHCCSYSLQSKAEHSYSMFMGQNHNQLEALHDK